MTNSTLSMSYCADGTLSRAHNRLAKNFIERSLILDVRRPAAMEATPRTIPGAILAPDLSEISKHEALFAGVDKVRLFCVHGYERSISASVMLQQFGCDIEDIPGGLEAFEEAGGETVNIVIGKTGRLGASRIWLFDDSAQEALVAWAMARFIDPLSDYRFVSKAHEEKVQIELNNAGVAAAFFPHASEENPLDALLDEFRFQNFPVLTDIVIPFLQQPATTDFLRHASGENGFAFCDHVWAMAKLKSELS